MGRIVFISFSLIQRRLSSLTTALQQERYLKPKQKRIATCKRHAIAWLTELNKVKKFYSRVIEYDTCKWKLSLIEKSYLIVYDDEARRFETIKDIFIQSILS